MGELKKDLSGMIFGDLEVLYRAENNSGGYIVYMCRCVCGKEKIVTASALKDGTTISCGCYIQRNAKVQIGYFFGEWEVIEMGEIRKNHRMWLCKCSCGTERWLPNSELTRGRSKSCGHLSWKIKRKIEIGTNINEWLVVREERNLNTGKSLGYLCRCSCGKEVVIKPSRLLNNPSKSCGHLKLTKVNVGDIFGRLTVLGEGERRGKKKEIRSIRCICECGNVKDIPITNLFKENSPTQSCGCLSRELSSIRKSEYLSNPDNRISKKYKWYFFDNYKNKIKCRSSFEVFVWNYYNFVIKEPIEYESKIFVIDESTRYTPDFYLPRLNQYLEPKGTFFLNLESRKQKENIELLSKTENIKIMFWEDIYDTCKLPFSSGTTYLEKSKRLKMKLEDYLAKMIYYQDRGGYDGKRMGKRELSNM